MAKKTMISLEVKPDFLERLNDVKWTLRVSRSEIVRLAVEEYLERIVKK